MYLMRGSRGHSAAIDGANVRAGRVWCVPVPVLDVRKRTERTTQCGGIGMGDNCYVGDNTAGELAKNQ